MAYKRILVVDDISVIRGFVKSALRDLRVTVAEASDGRQALDMHDTLPADVIICDIGMPNMGGEELVRTLREKGDTTPIIILTADADKGVIGRFVQLGIQGYVIKPFKPGVLSDRVIELLTGSAPPPPEPAPAEAAPAQVDADADTVADSVAEAVPDAGTDSPDPQG